MTVYVGPPVWPLGRMKMCHMVADTIDELHAMADDLGLNPQWFQDKRYKHYDISKSKREIAIKLGAEEVSDKDIVRRRLGRSD